MLRKANKKKASKEGTLFCFNGCQRDAAPTTSHCFHWTLILPVSGISAGLRLSPLFDKHHIGMSEPQDIRREEWWYYTRQLEHAASTK